MIGFGRSAYQRACAVRAHEEPGGDGRARIRFDRPAPIASDDRAHSLASHGCAPCDGEFEQCGLDLRMVQDQRGVAARREAGGEQARRVGERQVPRVECSSLAEQRNDPEALENGERSRVKDVAPVRIARKVPALEQHDRHAADGERARCSRSCDATADDADVALRHVELRLPPSNEKTRNMWTLPGRVVSANTPPVYSRTIDSQNDRPARFASDTRTIHRPEMRFQRRKAAARPTPERRWERRTKNSATSRSSGSSVARASRV